MKLFFSMAFMLFSILAFATPPEVDHSEDFLELEMTVDPTAEICGSLEVVSNSIVFSTPPAIQVAYAQNVIAECEVIVATIQTPEYEYPDRGITLVSAAFNDTGDKKRMIEYKPTNRKWYDHYYSRSIRRT